MTEYGILDDHRDRHNAAISKIRRRHEIDRLKSALTTLANLYRDDPPPLVRTASIALKGHIEWLGRQGTKRAYASGKTIDK
jgi:hypothetical protein